MQVEKIALVIGKSGSLIPPRRIDQAESGK
jgi:hypothetical protein